MGEIKLLVMRQTYTTISNLSIKLNFLTLTFTKINPLERKTLVNLISLLDL